MEFKDLQSALKDAMKARDTIKKEAVSTLIAAVKKTAIDEGVRDNISPELIDRVILKELKIAQEQVNTCPQDRTEQLSEYKQKLNVIAGFAPKQMSEDELTSYIKDKFSDLIAEENKAVYMKTIMADLKGKADGKLINKVISSVAGN